MLSVGDLGGFLCFKMHLSTLFLLEIHKVSGYDCGIRQRKIKCFKGVSGLAWRGEVQRREIVCLA